MRLTLLDGTLAIARLAPGDDLPGWATGPVVSLTRTEEELSVVCAEVGVPAGVRAERGWRALVVDGPLDLSLTGVLAALAVPLAEAEVPIFAVSTFDTDLLLVRDADLPAARRALRAAGHVVAG